MKNTLDEYHEKEVIKFTDIFFKYKLNNSALGKLQNQIQPAMDRFRSLEPNKKLMFKTTLARFNRIYSFITQVCRLFDKDVHKFSIYSKFLYMQLPRNNNEQFRIDDKILLEYYRLEKDFEGEIKLESSKDGFMPITGEAGRREKNKDPLTSIIEKINQKYGTDFTEMDKILLQIENDYAVQDKWHSYAKSNDKKTFMLLFEKNFPQMAANRYDKNEDFFVKMFSDPDMMKQIMDTIGVLLYKRLKDK